MLDALERPVQIEDNQLSGRSMAPTKRTLEVRGLWGRRSNGLTFTKSGMITVVIFTMDEANTLGKSYLHQEHDGCWVKLS